MLSKFIFLDAIVHFYSSQPVFVGVTYVARPVDMQYWGNNRGALSARIVKGVSKNLSKMLPNKKLLVKYSIYM